VAAGEFVAIVGRSGCGKSTLLRLLPVSSSLPAETSGWSIGPAMAPRASCFRTRVSCPGVPCWPTSSVGLGEGTDLPEERRRALDTLRDVGLESRRDHWPSVAFRRGQKQRVALARALVSRPRVLAFDEPLGALDALDPDLDAAAARAGSGSNQRFTAVMVTHDVAEAVALADRVFIIRDGEISRVIPVDLPRPRQRGSAEVAELEGRILRELPLA